MIFQSSNVNVIYDMVRNGNGAGILSRKLFSPLDPVSPFSFQPKFYHYSACFYRKGRELTEAEKLEIRRKRQALYENCMKEGME